MKNLKLTLIICSLSLFYLQACTFEKHNMDDLSQFCETVEDDKSESDNSKSTSTSSTILTDTESSIQERDIYISEVESCTSTISAQESTIEKQSSNHSSKASVFAWQPYDNLEYYLLENLDKTLYSETHVKKDEDTGEYFLEIWAIDREAVQKIIDQYDYKFSSEDLKIVFKEANCSRKTLEQIQSEIKSFASQHNIKLNENVIYDEKVIFRIAKESELLNEFINNYAYKDLVVISVFNGPYPSV